MGIVNDDFDYLGCRIYFFGLMSLKLCQCKEGYFGMYCYICRFGYYRLGLNMFCYKCLCDIKKLNGYCYFRKYIYNYVIFF